MISAFLLQALLLLAYLIRNGSERVVTSAREHIYDLRSLENYHFIGEFGMKISHLYSILVRFDLLITLKLYLYILLSLFAGYENLLGPGY